MSKGLDQKLVEAAASLLMPPELRNVHGTNAMFCVAHNLPTTVEFSSVTFADWINHDFISFLINCRYD